MNPAPIIFCAPEFLEILNQTYPNVSILAYSEDISVCQEQVADLDHQASRHVVILYGSSQSLDINQPVKDHLNLSKQNPLIGPADLNKGPRFPDMSSVYEADKGVIAVLGEDEDLKNFQEDWVSVTGGVWEAIALKHQDYKIEAWIVADLEKWISEILLFN